MAVPAPGLLRTLLLFLLAFAPQLNYAQTGFISIDCGIPGGTSYTDEITGIFYTSDADYISSGENREISSSITSSATITREFRTVRSFPTGERNCYTLKPLVKGNKYLVRASFMYGNVDGTTMIPNFDLYLDVTHWASISQRNASRPGRTEIITIAKHNFVSVCLVRRRSMGNPYISALELRPMELDMYNASTDSEALVLYNRYDVGSVTGQILRYGEDPYDRIWIPYNRLGWRGLSTTFSVRNANSFSPPNALMRTALEPPNANDTMYMNWTSGDQEAEFHIYRHFAEIERLENGQIRQFNVCIEGFLENCYNLYQPIFLGAFTIYTIEPFSGRDVYSSILVPTAQSTLPPILNALEIYTLINLSAVTTFELDVNGMMDIRAIYSVKKNWMGDPCVQTNYTWEGVGCSRDDSPRIVSLDLSFSGLNGNITSSFQNLTSLTNLDLSRNNLSGVLPYFLSNLPLTSLNLSGNRFYGSVPSALLERSRNGSLRLSIDGNPDLCTSNSCESKKSSAIPIAVSTVASVIGLLLAIAFGFWYWRKSKKRSPKIEAPATSPSSFNLDNRRLTFAELTGITNNFSRVLGRGGFGVVYHGKMKDGTEVAVKMLHENCSEKEELQREAQMLTKVYHRKLVQFVGYCVDGRKLALILEYLPNGNLAQALSEPGTNTPILNWDQRLRIALDIAQGLEYLHVGCKPPIIHRDVKPANILLNNKFEAKIADFGLCKVLAPNDYVNHVSTAVKGTFGYLDPEYFFSRNLNEKSDVYSFGIVLMELITGKSAIIQISENEWMNILDWVEPRVLQGDIRSIVDPTLIGNFSTESAWTALDVAIACSKPKNIERPTMSVVVAQLRNDLNADKVATNSGSSLLRYRDGDNDMNDSLFYPTPR